ncbi:MAG TPA: glycosyltransferase family 39 protein [Nitrososphaerales archaeon]|nr:glycosyltransferase family 39 protein [Nitrososphaerales archaeon]
MTAGSSAIDNERSKQRYYLSKKSFTSTTALILYLSLADFVAHLFVGGNYGYFRDELYYIVSGTQHLSLGYVDFPPFIAYVAALLYPISQDSLASIHIVSAAVESLLVFVAGLIAKELGGGRKAQLLAAVSTLLSLIFLAGGSIFTPDPFDQLWWSIFGYIVVRLVKRKEPKLWIVAGLVVGIGLLTKLTIFFFVATLLLSILAIPNSRIILKSKWIVFGGLLSIAFVIPMIYWNLLNGWPMVHFYQEFRGDVSGGGPANFFYTQLAGMSFLNFPIFIFGLYFYLRSKEGSQLRFFGLAYIVLYVFMTLLNMKPYYLIPIYPLLYAGGALLIEKSSNSKHGIFRWFGSRPYLACLLIVAILLAPVVVPILSPQTVISNYGYGDYDTSLLADRYGWSNMVSTLAQAYLQLPSNTRSQACILTSNYGEASAVNFLGRSMGLPQAISGHNNYYIWGPDNCSGQTLITVGYSILADQNSYRNVTLLTTIVCQYCIDYESNLPIYLYTNPNFSSLASVWPMIRSYD